MRKQQVILNANEGSILLESFDRSDTRRARTQNCVAISDHGWKAYLKEVVLPNDKIVRKTNCIYIKISHLSRGEQLICPQSIPRYSFYCYPDKVMMDKKHIWCIPSTNDASFERALITSAFHVDFLVKDGSMLKVIEMGKNWQIVLSIEYDE